MSDAERQAARSQEGVCRGSGGQDRARTHTTDRDVSGSQKVHRHRPEGTVLSPEPKAGLQEVRLL